MLFPSLYQTCAVLIHLCNRQTEAEIAALFYPDDHFGSSLTEILGADWLAQQEVGLLSCDHARTIMTFATKLTDTHNGVRAGHSGRLRRVAVD